MQRSKHSKRRAFTLLEVLMVVVIIGILAAIVVPNLFRGQGLAQIGVAEQAVNQGIPSALDLYRVAMGTYPEELRQLIEEPEDDAERLKWGEAYLEEKNLTDPWGNPYVYEYPGSNNERKYDLSSWGPDKTEGTEDDITNWEEE